MNAKDRVLVYLRVAGGAEMSDVARGTQLTIDEARAAVEEIGAEVWTSRDGSREYVNLQDALRVTK